MILEEVKPQYLFHQTNAHSRVVHILWHEFHPFERVLEALQFPTIQNMHPTGKGISTSSEKIEDPLIVVSQNKGIDPYPIHRCKYSDAFIIEKHKGEAPFHVL